MIKFTYFVCVYKCLLCMYNIDHYNVGGSHASDFIITS